jgi:hypothetical protein
MSDAEARKSGQSPTERFSYATLHNSVRTLQTSNLHPHRGNKLTLTGHFPRNAISLFDEWRI